VTAVVAKWKLDGIFLKEVLFYRDLF